MQLSASRNFSHKELQVIIWKNQLIKWHFDQFFRHVNSDITSLY